jgi:hypothetical protein
LLQRNGTGDKAAAKAILEEVVKDKQEGSTAAEQWLKNW